ncbi:MAG: hypothetical protein ACJ786_22855 [Catenulispora sp.]
MPKIDWTPGLGRRSRPLRRVLGMGQRQGLMLLSGIAAVMVLLATIAALGGFDGDAPKASGPADGSEARNGGGTAGAPSGKDSSKARQVLLASVQHYSDLLATGQKIVGHTRYADVVAYGRAFSDPKSPAAAFAKYRMAPNPEADTTFVDAAGRAAAADGGHASGALDQWSRDMAKAKADLGDWVAAAADFQQGAVTQAALDTAAAKVTQDLVTAKAEAARLGG